jgi:hypothetical protein
MQCTQHMAVLTGPLQDSPRNEPCTTAVLFELVRAGSSNARHSCTQSGRHAAEARGVYSLQSRVFREGKGPGLPPCCDQHGAQDVRPPELSTAQHSRLR